MTARTAGSRACVHWGEQMASWSRIAALPVGAASAMCSRLLAACSTSSPRTRVTIEIEAAGVVQHERPEVSRSTNHRAGEQRRGPGLKRWRRPWHTDIREKRFARKLIEIQAYVA